MDLSAYMTSYGDPPSGENLEYDPAFISLELAAQPGEERQVGDTIIAAEEPDHAEVIALATDIMSRSHDLRAAVFLAHSALRTEGFAGFSEVTGYIRWVLGYFWATCHPQLDADDEDDPTMRVNAVLSLAGSDTILRAIRLAPLTNSRMLGRFSLRDIQIADGEVPAPEDMESPPTMQQIAGAFQDSDPERTLALRNHVAKALEDVRVINSTFDERIPTRGPDLEPLEKILRLVLSKFVAAGVRGVDEEGDASILAAADSAGGGGADGGYQGGGAQGGGWSGQAGGAGAGGVNGQQDVRATLDRLIAYYARAEPSSPVRMLLERAKRLVGADFLTIIKELAPEGRSNVNIIGGIPDDEED